MSRLSRLIATMGNLPRGARGTEIEGYIRAQRERQGLVTRLADFERYFQLAHVLVDPETDPGGKRPAPEGCPEPPTARWWPARLGPKQHGFLHSRADLNVTAAGRRVFKSEAAVRRAVRFAITTKIPKARGFLCAPTQQQAEDIWWESLLDLIPPWALRSYKPINLSDRIVYLWNGSRIRVAGLDKPSRIEGGNWDFGCVTEYGDCKPDIYDAKIEPMVVNLADGAYCDIEGVPEGLNHYFRMKQVIEEQIAGGASHVAYWHWTTVDHLHLYLGRDEAERKIQNARDRLDPLLFRQEYMGDWVTFTGRIYHGFDRDVHATLPLQYNRDRPLIFAFDFNRKPGVAAVLQEQYLVDHPTIPDGWCTCVIGEVWIPDGSNTSKVAMRLRAEWEHIHTSGEVHIYGDSTGGRSTSSSVEGGDWTLVKAELLPWLGRRLRMKVSTNPHEIDRVNAVNSHLMSASGVARMAFCPINAPRAIDDFEGTRVIETGPNSGRIDKKSDPLMSHLSDAIGYYVVDRFPIPKELVRRSNMTPMT